MTVETPTEVAPKSPGSPASGPAESLRGSLLELFLRNAMLMMLFGLLIASTIMVDGFWQRANLQNIVTTNAPIGLIAIGMTVVVIAGGFDLSVGALYAGGAVLYTSLSNDMGLLLAFLLVLVAGGVAGAINGALIAGLRIHSFIATIATGGVISGLVLKYAASRPIVATKPEFTDLGLGSFHGIPYAAIVLAFAFILVGLILARTVYGRHVYIVGGSGEAARLVGLRVGWLRVSTFVLVGCLSVAGGALIASQLGAAQPTIGASIPLTAFAIVVIGGTSVYGGEGSMWRTFVGWMLISVMNNLFGTLGLDFAVQSIAQGGVLLTALALDSFARRRMVAG